MIAPIYLSVIIPVHNEQDRLEHCIEQLIHELQGQYLYEILIMDNASSDRTQQMGELYARIYDRVSYHRLQQRGKGLAVRHGMLLARGRYRYMCDVDLSTPAKEIHRFIEKCRIYDVVIGSRELDRSTTVTTAKRRLIGRIFHVFVGELLPRIQDTQCGFKMFRCDTADDVFENCHINGMAFDVEALYLARMMNYRIYEMPVHWKHDPNSRVRLLDDSIEMFWDVFGLYWRKMPMVQVAK